MDELSRRGNIRARLFAKGYLLSDVDRLHELGKNTASKTLQQPNKAGEAAICAILGVENPHELWPERYSPSGQRLSPFKYEQGPTLKQRRNEGRGLAAVLMAACLMMPVWLTGDSARHHPTPSTQQGDRP